MKCNLLLLFFFIATSSFAQIPKTGNDTLLDVASWNIEWFGDTENGPSDEAQQFANVKEVLAKTDIDVWGLCEVSDPVAWQNLTDALPQYASTIVTYTQTQKTALIWKKSMFQMISSQMVLTDHSYDYDFAGRPPLEVALKRTDSLYQDTIYFYIVHLKAYADGTSYGRRKNAAGYLKAFLEANRANKKVLVIGDWNDKIVGSTWSGTTESPFKDLFTDTARYFFVTKQPLDEGKKSYASSNGSMIDQIMMERTLDSFYVKNNARVLDMLPNFLSNYSSTTTDHYPVMGYFNFKRYQPVPVSHVGIAEASHTFSFRLYPNPACGFVRIEAPVPIDGISICDLSGKAVIESRVGDIDISSLQPGLYFVKVTGDGQAAVQKLVVK